MPPTPSGATISYGPSLVPEVSAICARHYSLEEARCRDCTDSGQVVGKQELIRFLPVCPSERSRWRGGRFACTSLIRQGSLEGLTVVRYDDVNMDSDDSSILMSINNGPLKQLLSIQQLPTQSRFKSHSSPRPPQTPAASF